jgi:hypothetical protein
MTARLGSGHYLVMVCRVVSYSSLSISWTDRHPLRVPGAPADAVAICVDAWTQRRCAFRSAHASLPRPAGDQSSISSPQ